MEEGKTSEVEEKKNEPISDYFIDEEENNESINKEIEEENFIKDKSFFHKYLPRVFHNFIPETTNILLLYLCFFIKSIDERLYYFSIPLLLTEMYGKTLFAGSLYAFVTNLFVFLLGPNIGNLVDKFPRFHVVMIASILQNIAISISGVLLVLMNIFPTTNPFLRWESGIFYLLLLFFGCIIQITSTTSNISISKDWAIIISKDKKTLTFVNATMSRTKLISEMIAPFLFSMIIVISNYYIATGIIIVWYLISFLPQILILFYIYKTDPAIAEPKKSTKKSENPMVILYKGWKVYISQKVFSSSFAYVLLYVTVLTPGVVFTIYLKINDFSETVIGIYRGVAAISGIIVTFIVPHLITKFKLIPTALGSIWSQFGSLLFGVACTIFIPKQISIYILMVSIVISRMALWSFDLSHLQIMQVSIKEEERGIVNSTEKAFTTLAYMIILLVSVIFSDPKFFEYLMFLSLTCVGISCFSFSFWTTRKELVSIVWEEENDHENEPKQETEAPVEKITATVISDIELMDEKMIDPIEIDDESNHEMDVNDQYLFDLIEKTKEEINTEL